MELKLVISSLLSRSLWMDCVSWPLVGVVPPSHSLGYLIWTLWSCFLSVYSNLRSIPNIKKFYKGGSRYLRYRNGMKHLEVREMWCSPKKKGSVRKTCIERSFDHFRVLVCSLLWLSVCSLKTSCYFYNEKKQSHSILRLGRLVLSRGKVLRNVHYLAIIFQMLKKICNSAMSTTRALKYIARQCTRIDMKRGKVCVLSKDMCCNPSLYISIYIYFLAVL